MHYKGPTKFEEAGPSKAERTGWALFQLGEAIILAIAAIFGFIGAIFGSLASLIEGKH